MNGYTPDILERARALKASRFTERVRAGRFVRSTAPDGTVTRTLQTPRYVDEPNRPAIAQVKYASNVVRDGESAGQLATRQDVEVHLPFDAPLLAEGDEIEITASTSDDRLIGRLFRVTGMPQSGQVSAHRYPVAELS